MTVAFYLLAGMAVAGAVLAVRLRNLVHAVLSLLLVFSALAGLYLLLLAEFVAVAQVLVYIGAVGILLLFAIMLTEREDRARARRLATPGWNWGVILAAVLLFGLLVPGIALSPLPDAPAAVFEPSARSLGIALTARYAVALEVVALLLTAALIGAVAIAGPGEAGGGTRGEGSGAENGGTGGGGGAA